MASWLDAIRTAALKTFACEAPWLAEAAVRYVASGAEPPTLLATIHEASRTVAAQESSFSARRADGHQPHWPVYLGLDDATPAEALRWAHIAEATRRGTYVPGALVAVAGDQLFDALLNDIDIALMDQSDAVRHAVPIRYATLDAMVIQAGGTPFELLTAAFTTPTDNRGGRHSRARTVLSATTGYADAVDLNAATLAPLAAALPRVAHARLFTLLKPLSDTQLGAFAQSLANCVASDNAATALEALAFARRCESGPMLGALKAVARLGDPAQRARAIRGVHALSAQPASSTVPQQNTGWSVDLTPALRDGLHTLFDRIGIITDADRQRIVAQLASHSPPTLVRAMPFPNADYRDAVEQFAAAPGVDATALFIVLRGLNWLFYDDRRESFSPAAVAAFSACQEATGRPTLAELAHRVDATGGTGAATVWGEYQRGLGKRWPVDAVWPFVLTNIDMVLAALTEPRWPGQDAPFRALATVPELPPHAIDQLFTFAVGRNAETRKQAQSALASVPDIVARVVPGLADSRADARIVAARWLADLGDRSAIPALEAALATERNDIAKGALLDGLSALGQPAEHYLTAATVDAEAQRGLRGGVPKALAWLDLAALPAVWWATGERAEPTTVLWLLALAVKGKSPAPDTLMRHYCGLLNPGDRQRLASFVLDSWITADDRFHAGFGSHPGRAPSVIGAKGVLALVAACGGDHAVATANHFIHANYGSRAAESRSLIEMLAWNDRPEAIQSLLAIATRFRTPGLRKEAESQVAALAGRRGWTTEELADRTAADGGFNADGVLRLEFVPGDLDRTFTATVQPDLSVVLRGPEGKVVKSLPAPRQSDDQQSAAAAKKALSAARKLVKAAAKVHTERLFAAMCSQRAWVFTDWVTYIQRHPIVGQLAGRLIWVADGVTLRPLDDGTLTDAADDEVTPAPDASIRLAHSLTVAADQHPRWRQHLIDYDVVPLFDQFTEPYALPPDAARATKLTDAEGRSMPYFTFRAAATARGYSRGAVGDGAVIIEYDKSLPTIGITVSLQFSGVDVSQPNDTVTLESAYFTLSSTDGGIARLGDVPPVLLSEVRNDLRQIAALAQTG